MLKVVINKGKHHKPQTIFIYDDDTVEIRVSRNGSKGLYLKRAWAYENWDDDDDGEYIFGYSFNDSAKRKKMYNSIMFTCFDGIAKAIKEGYKGVTFTWIMDDENHIAVDTEYDKGE